ncbi:MAG: hypothetical protein QHC90_04190 [Shinella sp.]|nr:hypothetical protein [Shinella sp.]
MSENKQTDRKRTTGGALDIPEEKVEQIETDSELKSAEDESSVDPDDLANNRARAEAVREHGDAYIVKTDLEDDDQRTAAPGTREQD